MTNLEKFWKALWILKDGVQASVIGEVSSKKDFDKILWTIGEDNNGIAITTTDNPHSEITWTKLKAEMDKL
tara:strand:+ start:534 stop:746 length:213 start_codon:yes stop_codon:yes gene_type:complete